MRTTAKEMRSLPRVLPTVLTLFTRQWTFNDRAFSIGYWTKLAQFLSGGNVVLSNATATTGISIGFNKDGYPQYTDHKTNTTYTATRNVVVNKWAYIVWKYDNIKQQLSLYLQWLVCTKLVKWWRRLHHLRLTLSLAAILIIIIMQACSMM